MVEHVLDRFNLTLARLDGGSNSGAYVSVPPWLVVVAMSTLDPVGEQLDYYDLYGFEDQVENDGELEVQIFRCAVHTPEQHRHGALAGARHRPPKRGPSSGPAVATAPCPSSSRRTSGRTCTG